MGVASESALAPQFDNKKNGHIYENGKAAFYKTTENGFFELKNIHCSTKFNKNGCKIGYLIQMCI